MGRRRKSGFRRGPRSASQGAVSDSRFERAHPAHRWLFFAPTRADTDGPGLYSGPPLVRRMRARRRAPGPPRSTRSPGEPRASAAKRRSDFGRVEWDSPYLFSESLANSDKVLGGADSWNRIKVAADVKADRPNWRGIAQPQSHVIRVELCEIVESNRGEDVAAIVEDCQPKPFLDRQRDSRFRIQYEKFIAAARDLDEVCSWNSIRCRRLRPCVAGPRCQGESREENCRLR